MRKILLLSLATGLMAGHAFAQLPSASEREAYLAYSVAAALSEGDLASDAAMVSLLTLQQQLAGQSQHEVTPTERALRAQADVLRAELAARVEAGLMDDPDLLARDLGCWHQPATPEQCAKRSQRLEILAGDNAYHHMELMGRAWKRGDAAKFLDHAKAAAAATHFRSPFSGTFDSVYRRLKQVPESAAPSFGQDTPGVSRAGVLAMSLSAAYAMPAYQNVSQPCREAEGELRRHCLAIALMQLESPVTLDVMIAASLVEALGEDQDRQLAQSRLRDVKWQMQGLAELAQRDIAGVPTRGYEVYFEEFGRRGELIATRDLLEANGIAAEPPEDWTPTP